MKLGQLHVVLPPSPASKLDRRVPAADLGSSRRALCAKSWVCRKAAGNSARCLQARQQEKRGGEDGVSQSAGKMVSAGLPIEVIFAFSPLELSCTSKQAAGCA